MQSRAAYTLGKVEDTVPDATAVVPGNAGDDVKYASNPADFDADRTDGNNDQRHRFVRAASTRPTGCAAARGIGRALVNGWTFSGIFTAQSGQPYTARVGAVDLNNDGNTRNDIAPGTVRNQFRLPAMVTLDPRIARDIRLGAVRAAADLGSVQSVQPRQHQRRRRDLYSVTGTTLTPRRTFGRRWQLRRAHHAARDEGHVLGRPPGPGGRRRSMRIHSYLNFEDRTSEPAQAPGPLIAGSS